MTPDNLIQLISIVVSVSATLVTASIAAVLSVRLARRNRADLKRQFCFELQRQFDSPEMFRCRFNAWRKLEDGEFDSITTVAELLASDTWTFEVSALIHFFESLERYCDEGLVDQTLAGQLFARTYSMWHERLLGRLVVDDASHRYAGWITRIRGLHARLSQ